VLSQERAETAATRPRDLQDNATPSGNAMAVTALLKLTGLAHDLRYVAIPHQALAQMQPMMAHYPLGFGQWLQALSFTLSQPGEIAIVGDLEASDTQTLLSVVLSGYRPFQVVASGSAGQVAPAVPLLQDRGPVDGQSMADVCDAPSPGRAFTCQAPVTEPEALRVLLEQP
jgi:uncharacterized protein YyaL (SSP411 family)